MRNSFHSAFAAMLLVVSVACWAGPSEDANAVVQKWSAAFTSNDTEAIVKSYWSDAVLLGTVSPVMSEGTEAIRTYFTPVKGSGFKNELGERRPSC